MIAATPFRFVAPEKFKLPILVTALPSIDTLKLPATMLVQFAIACCAEERTPPRFRPEVAVLAQRPIETCEGCGFCAKKSLAARYSGAVVPKSTPIGVNPG